MQPGEGFLLLAADDDWNRRSPGLRAYRRMRGLRLEQSRFLEMIGTFAFTASNCSARTILTGAGSPRSCPLAASAVRPPPCSTSNDPGEASTR